MHGIQARAAAVLELVHAEHPPTGGCGLGAGAAGASTHGRLRFGSWLALVLPGIHKAAAVSELVLAGIAHRAAAVLAMVLAGIQAAAAVLEMVLAGILPAAAVLQLVRLGIHKAAAV